MGKRAMTEVLTDCLNIVRSVGPAFADRAEQHDAEDAFVAKNYNDLKAEKYFSAMVPVEFGGGGATHRQMCQAQKELAGYCSSTALSTSMHHHLIAAALYNHQNGKPGEKLLRAVGAKELVLVSTGATDWLASNGTMIKVDGGYNLDARKFFASGSPAGDMAISSAPYLDPIEGWQVLHFPVPLNAKGVHIGTDWRAMGMRGTGSNTMSFDEVFIPEDSIALRRPQGDFHAVWNVVLTVAMPLIMSVYAGIAEKAAMIAREKAATRPDPSATYLLGEMENALATTQLAHASMVDIANNFDFDPVNETANAILIRKTIVAKSAKETVEKAMEACGGSGYFRATGLERLLRDVLASQFHPLAEKKQLVFTGRMSQGLDPVAALE
jgi:alkylation response protein AidB-like acyl-CoA dehydrogenase